MPRTGVTYDDVTTAIHQLEKAGLTPSIRLIREKLGKGSLSTIAEHKRVYDTEQAQGPGPALPDAVTKGLLAGAAQFWQELVDAADAQIDHIRAAADAKCEELKTELVAAQDALSIANDTVGTQTATIQDLERQLSEQQRLVTTRDSDMQKHAVTISRLEAERDSVREQNTSLHDQLVAAQQALTDSHAANAQLTERLERQAVESAKDKTALQKRFNEYKDSLVTVSDDKRQANKARRKAEKVAAAAEQRATDLSRDNARLERECTETRDEVKFLTEKLGEARASVEGLEHRLQDVMDQRDALRTSVAEAQALVRQYVETDRSLVQELIEERRKQATNER